MISRLLSSYRLELILIATLALGRISGFLRDVILIKTVGLGREADVLMAMLTVPDLLADILMVAGFSAVLVPFFVRLDGANLICAISSACRGFLIVSLLITVALFFNIDSFFSLLIPGIAPFTQNELQVFTSSVLTLPVVVVSGVFLSLLNSRGRYQWNGLSTILVNGVLIIGLFFSAFMGDFGFSMQVFLWLALCLRLALLAIRSFKVLGGWSFRPEAGSDVVSVPFAMVFIVAFSMASMNFFQIIVRSFGSKFGEGYMALYSFCIKLVQLPLAVVLASLGLVAVHRLSESYKISIDRGKEHFCERLKLSILVGYGLMAIAIPVIHLFLPQMLKVMSVDSLYVKPASEFLVTAACGFPIFSTAMILMSDNFARQNYYPVVWTVFLSLGATFFVSVDLINSSQDVASIWVISSAVMVATLIIFRLVDVCSGFGKRLVHWGLISTVMPLLIIFCLA